jgi:hypothetical protein
VTSLFIQSACESIRRGLYLLLYGFAGVGLAFTILYAWVWIMRVPYNSPITVAVIFFLAAFSAGITLGRK